MFYSVEYKHYNRPRQKAIVQANNEKEATLLFNNPEEIGKTAEILEVKSARRITKGWRVTYENDVDFLVVGETLDNVDLTKPDNEVVLSIRGKRKIIKVKDIVSSTKPPKDKNVMRSNRRISY